MLRVSNATLPWGRERLYNPEKQNVTTSHYYMLLMILDIMRPEEIEDSVFFYGAEIPGKQPWTHPFPSLAFSPSKLHNLIPWPWYTEFWYNYRLYFKFLNQHPHEKEISDSWIDETLGNKPWEERIPKAAFFAGFAPCRQILFDKQRAYPDLVNMSAALKWGDVRPWNPLSKEVAVEVGKVTDADIQEAYEHDPIGFAKALFGLKGGKGYNPGHYKYVVVSLAMDGTASSGRLLWLLSYVGCVVFLQEGVPSYHITSRMIPWVHYVPLSVSGADLAEKVAWLRQHDDMAKQIAENGRNFGRSYLRVEDYLCYGAKALKALGRVFRNSTATEPFDPVPLSNRKVVGLSMA